MYTPVALEVASDQVSLSTQSIPRKILVGLLAVGVVIGVIALVSNHSTPTADNAADSELFRKTSTTWSGIKNHAAGANVCSSSKIATLKAGMAAFEPAITKAVDGLDSTWTTVQNKDFRQFFGTATTKKTDQDVISILKDAQTEYMKFDSTATPGNAIAGDWNAECCAYPATDLCRSCFNAQGGTTGVMAFTRITAAYAAGRTIRFCPNVFSSTLPKTTVGLTVFHELIHMVTGGEVADLATYAKIGMTNKAKTTGGSDVTRLTANAYTMYVAKAGFSHKTYDKTTVYWGKSVEDVTCTDLAATATCTSIASGTYGWSANGSCTSSYDVTYGGATNTYTGKQICCKSCEGK